MKLDGSMTVERFTKTHNNYYAYASETHGVPNPDGTRVVWASNWKGANSGTPVYSYVAEWPQTSSNESPSVWLAPASQAASVGSAVTFTVGATGTPAPQIQWTMNGAPIAGAISSTLTIPSIVRRNSWNISNGERSAEACGEHPRLS